MDEVDQQAFDMTSIMVLIRHYHDTPIPQHGQHFLSVLLTHLQSNNLDDILNLCVLSNLLTRRIAHVQQLALQGKYAIAVAANHFDSCKSQRLS